jgi:hypothetical protein
MSNNVAANNQKPTTSCAATTQAQPARKKKLSLDISEIDVVLERKISP